MARVATFSCKKCRAAFLPGRTLEKFDLEVACVLALRATPEGERMRFLRKTLGLRAIDLAALLQVTAETLSRWEHGQRGIDVNAWITVGSLVLEKARRSPATLERLERLASVPAKLPKTIEVNVASDTPKLRVKLTRGSVAGKPAPARSTAASAR